MSAIAGFQGSVTVNGAVLRCQSWRLNWNTEPIDVTTFVNQGWASFIGGLYDADMELECVYDAVDNPFMGAPNLKPGSVVAVNLLFIKGDAVNRFSFPAITVLAVDARTSVREAVKYTIRARINNYEQAGAIKVPGQA